MTAVYICSKQNDRDGFDFIADRRAGWRNADV